ncbi:DUF1513 domain-containing protein [Vibrio chagasii]|nr:DUF1513 domain-containing protein [Vibrio chagasii]
MATAAPQGGGVQILECEPTVKGTFNHYIASIAASDDWIIATSPRGIATALVWQTKS